MKTISTFIKAIIAGAFISIGGTAFLMIENKIIGSLFFAVGLFAICTMGFNLFTGKVCYTFENKPSYILQLIVIWIGNLCGAILVSILESFTRIYPTLQEKALVMVQAKFVDNPISLLILGIFCNILIYLAVDGYKNNPHELGKYLAIIFGVSVFIICGFEHCVADMYYISIANAWTYAHAIETIIIVTIGNIIGGISLPLIKKLITKID